MVPRDLLCHRDNDSPHLEQKAFRFFVLSIFLSWPKSLSISCAAFVGENVALGWRYVLRMWKILWLMIHGSSLSELWRTRLRGGYELAMMMVVKMEIYRPRRSCWACVSQESLGKFQHSSTTASWNLTDESKTLDSPRATLMKRSWMSRDGDQLFSCER